MTTSEGRFQVLIVSWAVIKVFEVGFKNIHFLETSVTEENSARLF